MNLYFYGASGHAKVCIEIAEALQIPIKGCIDQDPQKTALLDYTVSTEIPSDITAIFLSIGNNKIRQQKASDFSYLQFPTLIHPQAIISPRTQIGEGTVIMAGVSMNSETKIGNHCIINTNASIDHDCVINDFVHISPNVALAGGVQVGEGTHIGIGACVIQNIVIGKNCTIGAGSVIIQNIPDGCTVVGNPGRIIKRSY